MCESEISTNRRRRLDLPFDIKGVLSLSQSERWCMRSWIDDLLFFFFLVWLHSHTLAGD